MLVPKAQGCSLICFNYSIFSFFILATDSWLFLCKGIPTGGYILIMGPFFAILKCTWKAVFTS